MNTAPFRLIGISLLSVAVIPIGAAKSYRLTVAATDTDRIALVVAFEVPAEAPKAAILRDAAGRALPLQLDPTGTARFLIPQQLAGETLAFTLTDGTPSAVQTVGIVRGIGDLNVMVDGKPTLVYRMNKDILPRSGIEPQFRRAAYIHPLLSPAGAVVTGDYPTNHPHHHGLWTSWSKVEYKGHATNFWEMAERKGTTTFANLLRTWSGPVHGGFVARQQLVDYLADEGNTALNEIWEVTTYNITGVSPAARVIDIAITQSCATKDPVRLPKHLYGGLGFRGRDEWNGPANLTVLTSEGATTRDTANTTRTRWTYLGGKVGNGAQAGVAILGHPDNVRAPQPIRVHPDMPFFCFTPVQLGDLSIEPGAPYVARYRLVVTDGTPDRDRFDTYWNAFAHPAVVNLEPL